MDEITIFNLRVVNKGVLKATVSIRLGNGLTIHDCKIIAGWGAERCIAATGRAAKGREGQPFSTPIKAAASVNVGFLPRGITSSV